MNPANARISALASDLNTAYSSQQRMQTKAISEVLKRAGYANMGVNSNQALAKVRSGEWGLEQVMQWGY